MSKLLARELHSAVFFGDFEKCKKLIREEAKKGDELYCDKCCPLSMAVYHGFEDIVRFLLDKKKKKDFRFNDSVAIFVAAQRGFTNLCRILIEEGGCDPNTNPPRMNCLHPAAVKDFVDTCKLLLEKGSVLDDEHFSSARSAEMLELFFDTYEHRGKEFRDESFLVLLLENGYVSMSETILKRVPAWRNRELSFPHEKMTALKYAISNGKKELVKMLVNVVDVEHYIPELPDWPPLMHSIVHGKDDVEMCAILVDQGKANVNLKLWDGTTALHVAMSYHKPKVAEFLLSRGADVDALDCMSARPFDFLTHHYDMRFVDDEDECFSPVPESFFVPIVGEKRPRSVLF